MTPEAIKAVREALTAAKEITSATGADAYTRQINEALALLTAEQAKAPPSSMDETLQKQFDRSRLTPSPRPATAAGIIDYPKAGAQAAKALPDRDWIGPFGPQDINQEARAGSLEIYADGVEALEKRVKGEEWLKALAIALREAAAALRLSPVTAGRCTCPLHGFTDEHCPVHGVQA